MGGLLADLSISMKRGLAWWLGELRALVPERLRGGQDGGKPDLTLSVERDGLRIIEARKGTGDLNDVWQHLALARSGRRPSVGLRLPLADCFVMRAEIPRAATDDAPRILALDLERATPFKANDVYTAHLLEPQIPGRATRSIRQLVTKRAPLDAVIADITTAGGRVVRIDCWDESGRTPLPINFHAPSAAIGAASRHGSLPGILAVSALILATGAGLIAFQRYGSALAAVSDEVAQARQREAALAAQIKTAGGAIREADAMRRLKAARPRAVVLLDELTRTLPDSVWLSDIKIEADGIEIGGFAKSAAALIPLLERSEHFSNASMAGPVTLDQGEDRERFTIRAGLRGHASPHQAGQGTNETAGGPTASTASSVAAGSVEPPPFEVAP